MKFRTRGLKSEAGPLLWNKYVFFMKWNNNVKKMPWPGPGPTGAPGSPLWGYGVIGITY